LAAIAAAVSVAKAMAVSGVPEEPVAVSVAILVAMAIF